MVERAIFFADYCTLRKISGVKADEIRVLYHNQTVHIAMQASGMARGEPEAIQ